jgi:hypothetical protein
LTAAIPHRHCERSEAIQSSVPHARRSNRLLVGANSHGAEDGTEDWIASLRSQ